MKQQHGTKFTQARNICRWRESRSEREKLFLSEDALLGMRVKAREEYDVCTNRVINYISFPAALIVILMSTAGRNNLQM